MIPTDIDLLIQIDRYLDQQMTQEESAAFELKIKTDAGLKEMVELSSLTRSLVFEKGIEENRAFLKQLEKQHLQSRRWLRNTMGVALVAMFLGVIGWWAWPAEKEKATKLPAQVSQTESKAEDNISSQIEVLENEKTTAPEKESRNKKSTEIENQANEPSTELLGKETTETLVLNPSEEKLSNETAVPKEDAKVKEYLPREANCNQVFKSVRIASLASCQQASSGSIQLSGIQKTWKIYLNEEARSASLHNLAPGNYVLKIITSQACSQEYQVNVPGKSCDTGKSLHWSFSSPDQWTIDTENKEGMLSITDRSGKLVLRKEISEFNNRISSDEIQETGLYRYQIKHSDGSTTDGFVQIVH
ncbi:MAG: hypothetical protein MUF42_15790 [Cytophagaceae bacterium]|jgi:hypothetical protein|nr:hypothetical protein [Cytophagaceae bacterium]